MDWRQVGVLTFHRCINYGSYWQAKCLLDALSGRGASPQILNHQNDLVNVAEWRCALQPTLPTKVSGLDREEYACKTRRILRGVAALPLSQPFELDTPEEAPAFHTLVVGSDEVWNQHHPWYANRGIFFGHGLRAGRLVSYGASFGNHSCWEGIGEPWTTLLDRFEHLSVRDENSWWMIKNSIGVEPEIVLDPCLLHPPKPEGAWQGPAGPFLLVYGHNFSSELATNVRSYARKRGLRLVSIGYRNAWADSQWLSADHNDFALAVQRAEAVATNFFHGCVFSLAMAKPFVCEATPYRATKLENLLDLTGAKRHQMTDGRDKAKAESLLSSPISDLCLEQIECLRLQSKAFLWKATCPEGSRK